jgi:hypothetical protein
LDPKAVSIRREPHFRDVPRADQPHRSRQFKLSNNPGFAAKLREIIGLDVEPPREEYA